MAVVSKFLNDLGQSLGIPALAISRTAYTAVILGYVYKQLYSKNCKTSNNSQVSMDESSLPRSIPTEELKRSKTPAVNK